MPKIASMLCFFFNPEVGRNHPRASLNYSLRNLGEKKNDIYWTAMFRLPKTFKRLLLPPPLLTILEAKEQSKFSCPMETVQLPSCVENGAAIFSAHAGLMVLQLCSPQQPCSALGSAIYWLHNCKKILYSSRASISSFTEWWQSLLRDYCFVKVNSTLYSSMSITEEHIVGK